MARVLGAVKLRAKKNGAISPLSNASWSGIERSARENSSGGEFGRAASRRSIRLGLINRTASDSHADQEDRHGSSSEEGEFRVVSAAERSRDAEPDKRNNESDFGAGAPSRRSRHEPAHA